MKHHYFQNTLFLLAILLTISPVYAQNQITGVVNYHENESNPLPDVTLELFDSGENLISTVVSNNSGEFVFTNIPSGEYHIQSTTSLPVGDINLIDASLILYNIFGWYSFNDYEFAAADVNSSGTITFTDYYLVLISYIMQGTPFSIDNWQFNEVYVDLTSRDSTENATVWGTSTGDVEGIWLPAGRNINILYEENNQLSAINDQVVELEIGSNYNELISGFNLNLTYPINQIDIINVTGPDNNFHYNLNKKTGELNVIWLDENENPGTRYFGQTLFRVTIKRNLDQVRNELFSLLEGGMVLDNESNQIEDITISLPKVTSTDNMLEFELTTFPNPVINTLSFKITSPINNYANTYIYDLSGKLVSQNNRINIYKGTQKIHIETIDLPSGQYIYKVVLQNSKVFTGSFDKIK